MKEILRSYKILYFLEGIKLISKSKIIDYALKRHRGYYGDSSKISNNEWDEMFNKLETYGFIKYEDDAILCEEIYLEKIISTRDLTESYIKEIITYYPKPKTCAQLIYNSNNYEDAKYAFEIMNQNGIEPNVFTYSILVFKCGYYEEALEVFSDMVRDNIKPNVVTYSTLISKTKNYEDALSIYNDMLRQNVAPNIVVFNRLLIRCDDSTEIEKIFQSIKENSLEWNVATYWIAISKSPDFVIAWEYYQQMISQKKYPTDPVFYILITKSRDQKDKSVVFEEIKRLNYDINAYIYNAFMEKSDSYLEAEELYIAMIRKGVQPTLDTCNVLITKSEDFNSAINVFKNCFEFSNLNLSPNLNSFRAIAMKTTSEQEVEYLISKMLEFGADELNIQDIRRTIRGRRKQDTNSNMR